MSYDFAGLDARLLLDAEATFYRIFPAAVTAGIELCIGNLKGDAGRSLKFNSQTGVWKDFGTEDAGVGFISLVAAKEAISQGEAYRQLGGAVNGSAGPPLIAAPVKPPFEPDWQLQPVPDHAPRTHDAFEHPKHGAPANLYPYTNLEGELLFMVARYEARGGKTFCPWVWKADAWRPEGPPAPRPLYGLLRVGAQPDAKVVLVEGEKAADALARLLRQPVVTWPNGAAAVRKADWGPLKGRKVVIWPDADQAGMKAAQSLVGVLMGLGCELEMVDVSGQPDGWDAADGGWETVAQLSAWLKGRVKPVKAAPEPSADAPADVTEQTSVRNMPTMMLWERAGLQMTGKGVPYGHDHNMAQILEYSQQMTGSIRIWWDSFLCRMCYEKDGKVGEWSDTESANLLQWVQSAFQVPNMNIHSVTRAVDTYARRHARNCVRDWLATLTWDGVERLPKLMASGFGATDNNYSAQVGRCFMVGMVARAMRPGCKVDTMPVFEGKQGAFKSSALKIIGGDWFAEVHESILTKDFQLAIQGKLLVEISELHSFRRHEMTAIKGRISDACDRFRAPYERTSRDWPRQGVFAGTTNEDDWNTDSTGARRFWPINCKRIDLDWIRENREQLFAEAAARFKAGEAWHDVDMRLATVRQEARRPDDPWQPKIENWLGGRTRVVMDDLLNICLEIPVERQDLLLTRRLGNILRGLGYEKQVVRDGATQRTRKAWIMAGTAKWAPVGFDSTAPGYTRPSMAAQLPLDSVPPEREPGSDDEISGQEVIHNPRPDHEGEQQQGQAQPF